MQSENFSSEYLHYIDRETTLLEPLLNKIRKFFGIAFFYKALVNGKHCVKNVRIRSFYDPYSAGIQENTNQENSKYEHFHAV